MYMLFECVCVCVCVCARVFLGMSEYFIVFIVCKIFHFVHSIQYYCNECKFKLDNTNWNLKVNLGNEYNTNLHTI